MNGKDEISKKRLYIEGLKQAIALPLPEELGRDMEEVFQDDEVDEDIKETIRFWKEVEGPFGNAIVYVHNNRFLVEEKNDILNGDEEKPFMMPDAIFNILRTLLNATVMEFLSVLRIPSCQKAQLLAFVESDNKGGFISLIEHTQCDTTELVRLCSKCKDSSSILFEMEGDDYTYYLDHVASDPNKEEDADKGKWLKAVRHFQPFAEVLVNDESEEALKRYFYEARKLLDVELTTNLHYYWDWYEDFTLKERNFIEPILDHPLAEDLVKRIRKNYEANLIDANKGLKEDAPLEHATSKTITDGDKNIPVKLLSEDEKKVVHNFRIWETYFSKPQEKNLYGIKGYDGINNEKFFQGSDEEKAKKLRRFIRLLARTRCIEPTQQEMQSCAYAFTGRCFRRPFKPTDVYWKSDKFEILLYICKRFFKKEKNGSYIPAVDVFHVREEYEKCDNPSLVADKVESTYPDFHKEFKKIYGWL